MLRAALALVVLTVAMTGCAGASRDHPTEGTPGQATQHERGGLSNDGRSAVAGMSVEELVGQIGASLARAGVLVVESCAGEPPPAGQAAGAP